MNSVSRKPQANRNLAADVEELPLTARVVRAPIEETVDQPADTIDTTDEPLGRFGRSKKAILITVFLVAGILGLPLVLLSPAFNRIEKAFWTVIILIYTVLIFYVLYRVAAWAHAAITDALSQL